MTSIIAKITIDIISKFMSKTDNELQYIDDFYKKLKSISKLRYKAMDGIDELNAEILELSKTEFIPDYIWSSIGLEFFHSDRFHLAEEAYKRAIESANSLPEDEKNVLRQIYGDLSMVYEHDGKYVEALDVAQKALKVSKEFYDETNDKVKEMQGKVNKLKKLV